MRHIRRIPNRPGTDPGRPGTDPARTRECFEGISEAGICDGSFKGSNSAGMLGSLGAIAASAHSYIFLYKPTRPNPMLAYNYVPSASVPCPGWARTTRWRRNLNFVGTQDGGHHRAVRSNLTIEVAMRTADEPDRSSGLACQSDPSLRLPAASSGQFIRSPAVAKPEKLLVHHEHCKASQE